jgi:hypothetical protein
MSFQRKLIVVALATAMPWVSAQAQSAADLKKEIDALKAQLQVLQQKIDAVSASAAPNEELSQKVNRLEQKQDLANDALDKSGLGGIKVNGTIEASYQYNDLDKLHSFGASSGYTDSDAGVAMIQITKESQDGEGVDWTLRLLPGSTAYLVNEASISIPIDKTNRIIGGHVPDFQGYEFSFPNADPTLGNQLISHNALFDLAGAAFYDGIGMSHSLFNGNLALKWMVANIDSGTDTGNTTANNGAATNALPIYSVPTLGTPQSGNKTYGVAVRGDYSIDEYTFVGAGWLAGNGNRNFSIIDIDGGYTHGDWAFNGQFTVGTQQGAAYTGEEARWSGVSAEVRYKVVPRLQLIARADYLDNRTNGGGTYAYNGESGVPGGALSDYGLGIGRERDSAGNPIDDHIGANLTRITLGTNYQINPNTQWKVEYRLDQSTGYNFLNSDGVPSQTRNAFATSFVLSF